MMMFLVEVVIIVIVGSDKTTAELLPGREVLVLRRCRYNRVIASTVEKEREGGGKLEPMQS